MLMPQLIVFFPYSVYLLLLGIAVSAALSALAIRAGHRFALHDVPGARSSHDVPTPRLGGPGLGALPLLVLLAGSVNEEFFRRSVPLNFRLEHGFLEQNRALLLGAALFLALGLWDDLKALSPKVKLLGQLAAAAAAVLLLALHGKPDPPLLGVRDSLPRIAFGVLWVIGVVNVLNFMDGLNGQAGVFSLIALFFGALIYTNHPLLVLALLGSIIGFLCFNLRRRAGIFMGDGGSHFLGFMLGMISLQSMTGFFTSGPALHVYLILLLPFLYDVSYTLLKRLAARRPLWRAHREHLYQRLLICGWSHPAVLALNVPLYLICGVLALQCAWTDAPGQKIAYLSAGLALMVVYTLFVLWVERRNRFSQQ